MSGLSDCWQLVGISIDDSIGKIGVGWRMTIGGDMDGDVLESGNDGIGRDPRHLELLIEEKLSNSPFDFLCISLYFLFFFPFLVLTFLSFFLWTFLFPFFDLFFSL